MLSIFVVVLLAVGLFSAAKTRGLLSPLGIRSESHDSQVIRAIARTEEVALVRLGIQGIKEQDQSGTIFGQSIPGAAKKLFLEYSFDAKLGVDGRHVKVRKTGQHRYEISVPHFKFIGYARPHFEVAAEDGGVLSFTTPDIDQTKMVNEVLGPDDQDGYLKSNRALLREQTKVFYDNVVKSIDPTVQTTYQFSS